MKRNIELRSNYHITRLGYYHAMKRGKWSEREDLNLRPLVPQTSALTRLRYAPNIYVNLSAFICKLIKDKPGLNFNQDRR